MCGGPSKEQRAAASSQANLTNQQAAQSQFGLQQTNPYATQLLNEGIPYFADIEKNGLPYFDAQSDYTRSMLGGEINRAKSSTKSRLAGYGSSLPSGFAEASLRDIDTQGARIFDQGQLALMEGNQNAKTMAAQAQAQARMSGAQLLNPAQYANLALSGNNSIMQAPLQNQFWGNLVSGIVQGGARVASAYAGR